ncbi:Secretory lipase [Corynebacterium appendicis CIP 107643]|uniref:Secretory lipase n=1 Tax=Corynebacterium appendicis CIP 107643 TaxID=1161099 RepID=A0A1N7J6L9_9CORY|nr:lipase family protein [Corynebacterium appendicis]WJY61846.1 putative inactive lipase [Corynebacterium appendicis CIP 107643]SIS44952.1 Secretory lipase [Corynebacterium appendicis CIP 107643]
MFCIANHSVTRSVFAIAVAALTLVTASLAPRSTAGAQTADELRNGIHHAATTPGGDPVHRNDPFYDDPVPAAELDRPGEIVRAQPAPHLLNILGPDFYGHAKRIIYTSTTVNGDIVPVSGAIIEPANPWRGKGPRPTVVFGPGTRGAGDACAPSRGAWMMGKVDLKTGAVGTNYELPSYHAAALLGMRVVVTDYIGLGTRGAHTYVLHEEEANAMLDAARSTAPPGHPVGFWGYSQGGGAAAAAAERASTYAPDVNVKATFAGAPPADLLATMRGVDNSTITAVLGYALSGWKERYPELGPSLEPILNNSGREFLASVATECIADSAVRWGMSDSRAFTTNGRSISEVVAKHPELHALIDAQKLGRTSPSSPIMITTAGNDDVVPSDQVVQLARDHCALGADVSFYDGALPPLTPGIKSGVNHAIGVYAHLAPSMMWMMDRFNGVPNQSNCGTF